MFDIILIPLSVAWDGHDGDFETIVFKVGVIFWSVDVLMSLNTGFDMAGMIVVSRSKILKRYAKTWLGFDFVTLVLDYFLWAMTSTAVLRGLRGLRGVRLLRLVRIVRILKVSRFSLMLEDVQGCGFR